MYNDVYLIQRKTRQGGQIERLVGYDERKRGLEGG